MWLSKVNWSFIIREWLNIIWQQKKKKNNEKIRFSTKCLKFVLCQLINTLFVNLRLRRVVLFSSKLAFQNRPNSFDSRGDDGSESREGDDESRGRRVGVQGECASKVLPPRMEHRQVTPRRHRFQFPRLRPFLCPQNQIHCTLLYSITTIIFNHSFILLLKLNYRYIFAVGQVSGARPTSRTLPWNHSFPSDEHYSLTNSWTRGSFRWSSRNNKTYMHHCIYVSHGLWLQICDQVLSASSFRSRTRRVSFGEVSPHKFRDFVKAGKHGRDGS